jgi:CheY-like chemotaxis protein
METTMANEPWRVLLVDAVAEPKVVLHALREAGAIVSLVHSAQVALLMLESEPFDQIVTDLALPDVDGYALLRAVRRLPEPVGSLKVVALCPDTDAEAAQLQALMAGFHLAFRRSAPPDTIAIALRGMARLDRRAVPRPAAASA